MPPQPPPSRAVQIKSRNYFPSDGATLVGRLRAVIFKRSAASGRRVNESFYQKRRRTDGYRHYSGSVRTRAHARTRTHTYIFIRMSTKHSGGEEIDVGRGVCTHKIIYFSYHTYIYTHIDIYIHIHIRAHECTWYTHTETYRFFNQRPTSVTYLAKKYFLRYAIYYTTLACVYYILYTRV